MHALLFFLVAELSASLVASPPASIEDALYVETIIAGSNTHTELFHLGPGGIARRIYGVGWGAGTGYEYIYSGSEQLTYAYTPPTAGDPLAATLSFSGGTLVPDRTRTLTFADGSADGGSFSPFGGFRFYARAALTGAANTSNRLWLHPGETNITGFALPRPRWVLVRGVGPSLANFDVPLPVTGTSITLFSQGTPRASNSTWGTDGPDAQGMGWLFGLASAFALESNSQDSALFMRLEAGSYTTHVVSQDSAARGEALIEVYLLPYE